MTEILTIPNGYDRGKTDVNCVECTFDDILSNNVDGFIDRNGHYRNCRSTGKVKTWKTRPNDLSAPFKYGMYESFRVEYRNGEQTNGPKMVRKW